MGLIAGGVAVRLIQSVPGVGKRGQYYAGTDSGTYGSGYPIYRDLPYVMDGSSAAQYVQRTNDPVRIFSIYVDDGE